MYNWAELIYGRTLEVDFRFLASPNEDKRQLLTWIEPYVLESTRMPEKLPGRPRWSIVRNEQYCLIGVTCMASELIAAASDPVLETMSRDNHGRSLYLFAGYIAYITDSTVDVELPSFESLDLQLFAPLYRQVAECWDVKAYDPKSREPISTHFHPVSLLDKGRQSIRKHLTSEGTQGLNAKPKFVGVFPDEAAERQRLWSLAASTETPISLCLGLARQRDAIDGPFLNVSVDGVASAEVIPLRLPEQPERISRSASQPKASDAQSRDRTTASENAQLHLQTPSNHRFLAVGVGAGIGIWVAKAWSIPMLPAVLGLSALSYFGMGLFDRDTGAHKKRSTQNPPSPEQEPHDTQEKPFGLKQKPHTGENSISDKHQDSDSPWKL